MDEWVNTLKNWLSSPPLGKSFPSPQYGSEINHEADFALVRFGIGRGARRRNPTSSSFGVTTSASGTSAPTTWA
jgi:hypothetical protein